jgi:hypothetical protein
VNGYKIHLFFERTAIILQSSCLDVSRCSEPKARTAK